MESTYPASAPRSPPAAASRRFDLTPRHHGYLHYPNLVVLAGPNGAGKTTASRALLADALAVEEFVNADTIAKGLSAFRPESVAFDAGRIMLKRLDELTAQHVNVAFETTLASRLWLPSPDMAVERVQTRVSLGGHDVPEATIRRRYEAGLRNFFRIVPAYGGELGILQQRGTRPARVGCERRQGGTHGGGPA